MDLESRMRENWFEGNLDNCITIAREYAEEMCKEQIKLCCKRYYDATMANEDIDLEDTTLATEAQDGK